jgi:hypothetical protein
MVADPARERRPRRARRLALPLALLAASSGCSFKIVKGPPPTSTWPNPVTPSSSQLPCTEVYAIPVVDSVVTGGLGIIAYREQVFGQTSNELLLGLGALPFLASAIYGYVETARCARYKALFQPPP